MTSAAPVEPGTKTAQGTDIGGRLVAGERTALTDCYRELGDVVRRYVGRFVPYHDVDDVTQRVFLDLWRTRTQFDPTRHLRPWVLTIARYRALDHVRRIRTSHTRLDDIPDVIGDDGREIAVRHASAGEVGDALCQLSDDHQAVMRLAYFDGYTQREISVLLDIPLGTVKTRSARALNRLSHILDPANS